MAYIKNPTEEQRKEWKMQAEKQSEHMQSLVKNLAESYQENPENIAELLEFGSKFYRYSLRNNMLIYAQNPHSTYVQSFKAWKDMGYAPKRGEQGLKVYVPVQATILKDGNELVPLEQATAEQKAQYKAGEIESTTQTRFKMGTVFDIAQTTFPKEQYPKLFHMGYPSELHKEVTQGLVDFAEQSLNYTVKRENMNSISLRGLHIGGGAHEIQLNEKLEDTQRLSTLAHELGHAILHQEVRQKPLAQIEMEADALGIMIESYFGIKPTETRRRHLAENFRTYQKEYQEHPEKTMDSFGDVLKNVYQEFRKVEPDIAQAVERYAPLNRLQQAVPREVEVKSERLSRSEIYDEIKQSIHILDYAQMHGLNTRRVGRYYTLPEHDSVRIDPEKNCFWRNSGIGQNTTGSVIDFAMAFVHDGDIHAALTELQSMISTERNPMQKKNIASSRKENYQTERQNLKDALPEHAENMRRVYAYLIKSRYIDQDIVQDFIDRKMLYQDTRGNCVFVAYDQKNEPNFATLRGTLTDKKFMGDVPGCDYSRDFYINNNAEKMIVTESVIDAMSIMSILKGQGQDPKEYDYLVQTGTQKYEAILTHLEEHPKQEVLLSLDHDVAGVTGMKNIRNLLHENKINTKLSYHVPELERKDWNGALTYAAKKFKPMDSISYLQERALPMIKYCAVQSTEQIEEKGFRKRGDKNQYRLVEIKDEKITPMDINKNILYTDPAELKSLIPPMYVMVDYSVLEIQQEALEELNKEQSGMIQSETESIVETNQEAESGGLIAKDVSIKDGMYQANVELDGEMQQLTIWKRGGEFHVETGYAYDGTLQEHPLNGHVVELLDEEVLQYPDGPVMQKEMYPDVETLHSENQIQNPQTTDFLNQLQKQELRKDRMSTSVPVPQQEMSMGIGS